MHDNESQEGTPAQAENLIPKHNVMQDDFDWEIPVSTVPVPSEGKVYPQGSNISGRTTLDIKAMTAREEDILTSTALIRQGTVLNHLIQSCLIDKSVSVDDMLLGDRNALMISVRITGYGAAYEVQVNCPECGEQSDQKFDLSELEIKRLEIEPVTSGENRFSFTLPVSKKEVHFKFLTGKDEREMTVVAERKKKLMPGTQVESNVTSRLEHVILSIDGIEDRNKINSFIKNMPALDSRRLRTHLESSEPGIDMGAWMGCPHCSESSKISMPLGINFFWPRG
jgi:hypothetical protein